MKFSCYCIVTFCLLITNVISEECGCNQIPSVEIINDETLALGIKEVRDDFLAKQVSSKFTRLSATILIREENTQTWKRGSVNGTLIEYPASTVKLMYMYAAIDWCKKQGQSIDCLDRYVRPMVVVSSNLDTGYVVDAITNTTNIEDLTSTNDTRWSNWLSERLSIERLLKELNVYENQIIRSKTYPTNSGQSPIGSESVLLRTPYSRNLLQSCCTASFMLYLMQARPQNELQYMKPMLYRTLESDHTTFGNGLPAGTIIYSKSGNAYDTIEEIAYMILPNGKEIILSAFSNGYQRGASDYYILGRFAEMVLAKFSLNSPSTIIFTTDNPDIYTCSNYSIKYTSSLPKDNIGQSLIEFNGSCIIHPTLSERGVYTVSVWNPSFFDSSMSVNARLNVAVTDAYNVTDGDDGYIYDQQNSFSRWISVGDFLLNPGRQNVYLKSLNQKSVFNAIRFSKRPPLTIDTNTRSTSSILISYKNFIYFSFLCLQIRSLYFIDYH
ncbi:unnamed protein product [Rotaria socialis]|uniref:Beta-lactamase class A catalytic domain-containing protein n=1 Tax=Rotaria socialis TaxID=392032 RepID=A0A820VW91_9BILA|nr:unnamed protein product [Rotaria socialis]CAF4505697.1 unnamed protein product [Rotaria socialis]